jgi:hypothetical protein
MSWSFCQHEMCWEINCLLAWNSNNNQLSRRLPMRVNVIRICVGNRVFGQMSEIHEGNRSLSFILLLPTKNPHKSMNFQMLIQNYIDLPMPSKIKEDY